jgi:phosphotransferase system IIB component
MSISYYISGRFGNNLFQYFATKVLGKILNKEYIFNDSKKPLTRDSNNEKIKIDNMVEIGACMSRLRITVADSTKVDEVKLKSLGASGVLKVGKGIQSIFGTKSDLIKQEILNIKEGN